MLVAFYVLFESGAPIAAKVVFTALPVAIWIMGGLTIHREYKEQKRERQKQDEILDEARHILNDYSADRRSHDNGRDRSRQEERHD